MGHVPDLTRGAQRAQVPGQAAAGEGGGGRLRVTPDFCPALWITPGPPSWRFPMTSQ